MGCDLFLKQENATSEAALVGGLIAAKGRKVKQKRALLDG
jgi:hypothetical protein